jgi:hypothetical protein
LKQVITTFKVHNILSHHDDEDRCPYGKRAL